MVPDAASEFQSLKALLDKFTYSESGARPPLALFGHADTTGQDEYNKRLSGRRAEAVYAVLTRNTDMWETLYSSPFGGDVWGDPSIRLMLHTLSANSGSHDRAPGATDDRQGADAENAVKDFQRRNGLAVDGICGPQTRKKLFASYMDALCKDAKGTPYTLLPEDFLGRGAAGGKASYQGCSDFNPLLLFSQDEREQFDRSDDKTERNRENAPNRRVIAFLFSPGVKIETGRWPCPLTSEGSAPCKQRFWSDAERRRRFGPERRAYEDTHDTFACRFYDRLAGNSPCEHPGHVDLLIIRLVDTEGIAMANLDYRLDVGESTFVGTTDSNGKLVQVVPADSTAGTLVIPQGSFALTIVPRLDPIDGEDGARARLNNLGFIPDAVGDSEPPPPDDMLRLALLQFQTKSLIEANGTLDSPTQQKLKEAHVG
jgi:hypothetical protein